MIRSFDGETAMLQTCPVYGSVLSFVLDARYQKLVGLSTPRLRLPDGGGITALHGIYDRTSKTKERSDIIQYKAT